MNHKRALDLILANSCTIDHDKESKTFMLDLHCAEAIITAKLASDSNSDDIRYDIIDVKIRRG